MAERISWDIRRRDAVYWETQVSTQNAKKPYFFRWKDYKYKFPFEQPVMRDDIQFGFQVFNIHLTEDGDPNHRQLIYFSVTAPDGYKAEQRHALSWKSGLWVTDLWVDFTDFFKYMLAKGFTSYIFTLRCETDKDVRFGKPPYEGFVGEILATIMNVGGQL